MNMSRTCRRLRPRDWVDNTSAGGRSRATRTTFRPCRHHRRGPPHRDSVLRRLGLEVEGKQVFVEGTFLDTVIGIPDSRTEIVMLRPPDGGTRHPYPRPPPKGQVRTGPHVDTRMFNSLLRHAQALGERTAAELKQRWGTLQYGTRSPAGSATWPVPPSSSTESGSDHRGENSVRLKTVVLSPASPPLYRPSLPTERRRRLRARRQRRTSTDTGAWQTIPRHGDLLTLAPFHVRPQLSGSPRTSA
jgi:hypothetical protein